MDDARRVEELTADIQQPTRWAGRRVRGLRPWAEDMALWRAIHHGDFLIHGLRNRDRQQMLYGALPESPVERRRRSGAVRRKLRLLRAHGLIRKIPRTHRYQVADSARAILVAVLTTAATSLSQLNQLAKAA